MPPFFISLITLVCVLLGLVVGLFLRRLLPEHHLKDDSKDVLKTTSGLIATLVALVLGLLVASTKGTFDTANIMLMQEGAKFITLDRYLAAYGPEARPLQKLLKNSLEKGIQRMWPEEGNGNPDDSEMSRGLQAVYSQLVALQPSDASRKLIQGLCLAVCTDLLQSRWMLLEQTQYRLPIAFVVVLVFWLTVLYANFGLLSPLNPTALIALLVCAMSISGAIFLILEMIHPFDGFVKVSSGPFVKALSLVGQ